MRKRPPFRRSRNRIIAGVCAGVSEWLGWEPLAGRLFFVLISVMSVGVPGLIVYLVLWTIMPGPEDAEAG
jgi:phage shock protein C